MARRRKYSRKMYKSFNYGIFPYVPIENNYRGTRKRSLKQDIKDRDTPKQIYSWGQTLDAATMASLGFGALKVARYGKDMRDFYQLLTGRAPLKRAYVDPWDVESQRQHERLNYDRSHIEV